jgi:peptide/nickel transport system ATP-binding protein
VEPESRDPLLSVDDIVVEFPLRGWRTPPLRVLDGVSLRLDAGETLGLVGESGSGKSTIGRSILGLIDIAEGEIRYDGNVISGLPRRERRRLSQDIQVVFQDPYTSLNPAMSVSDILTEPLLVHGIGRREAEARVREELERVRLPVDAGSRYPREFSGGQRQRIAIARALTVNPRIIVCDEPVSSLDLSTQARVLELLVEIQETTGHPYTQRLLMSAPVPDPDRQAQRRAERARIAQGS